jgi:hypothetical protein
MFPVSGIAPRWPASAPVDATGRTTDSVFAGQCCLIEMGFRQGGPVGYGLRRVLVDEHGLMKTVLCRGEHKSLQIDRVILVPGPECEMRTVNLIYNWFIDESLDEYAIAARLNSMHVRTDLDRESTRATVREVLTNGKYIGNNVYNRVSFKLKKMRVTNTPDMWISKGGS